MTSFCFELFKTILQNKNFNLQRIQTLISGLEGDHADL